jgi:hypothetical protein
MSIPDAARIACALSARVLSLNATTIFYSELWRSCWNDSFSSQRWSSESVLLNPSFFRNLNPDWHRNCTLRADYSRRQALIEIDVLVSQALRLSLEELLTIYRVQFSVLRQNEADTWYDQTGRIVFTPSKGLVGVGLPRKARKSDLHARIRYGIQTGHRNEQDIALGWEDVKNLSEGIVTKTFMDDTLPGGPFERTVEYHAPFIKPNREKDYAQAWQFFSEQSAAC